MNKFAQIAFRDYLKRERKEQLRIIQLCYSQPYFTNLQKRLKNRFCLNDAIKHFVKHCYVFKEKSICGCSEAHLGRWCENAKRDRLAPTSINIPTGRFYGNSKGGFSPVMGKRIIHSSLADVCIRSATKKALKNWDCVKKDLGTRKGNNKIVPARLDFDQKSCKEWPDVYFIRDKENARIKIGCSKDPVQRMQQIIREYDCGKETELILTVQGGGYDMEALYHERFSHLNIKDCYGNEWFYECDEIMDHLQELRVNSLTDFFRGHNEEQEVSHAFLD
tara:strand:+ start:260 stop:1090 length:831 start_codon:yes stop_codon:yes gene_type:complete